ncbi:MAG TPA: aldo/keto reductase [Pyrinomonadaceae bacterium]|jgi:aryl-alcohol dehydrogenase-like predicted oxidoreductase
MTEKFATGEGTRRFAEKFKDAASGHFRAAQGLAVSSVGIGTYLGNWDAATDENYTNAIVRFVGLGGNVIDTAANYRFQRSERNIGKALEILSEKGFARDEIVICTKAGYLPFDGEPPRDVRAYFQTNFVEKGIATFDDLVGGSHCMTPAYLENQINQSLQNMNVDCLDVFYIHNPESQLSEIPSGAFEARLARALEKLEELRQNGKLQFYGAATWNGFRIQPSQNGYHSLEKMVNIARQIGGDAHGFRFIQLPFNLAMPEALLLPNQQFSGQVLSTVEAAKNLDVSVVCSASIFQGKLARNLPANIRETFSNLDTDALASLQFVRSTPFVTTALVGMSLEKHVEENMRLARVEPASAETYGRLFS